MKLVKQFLRDESLFVIFFKIKENKNNFFRTACDVYVTTIYKLIISYYYH